MDSINNEVWLQKAIAFTVRARAEMWGKHNTEIMAFVYDYGFLNRTVEKLLLGWNRRYKSRPVESWGLESSGKNDKLLFPEGIVVPYVVDEALKKITIVRHMDKESNNNYLVPGSLPLSMVFGEKDASVKIVIDNILDAFILVQEFLFNKKKTDAAIVIPHDLAMPCDEHAAAWLGKSREIICCSQQNEEVYEKWMVGFDNITYIRYGDPERLAENIASS